MKSKYKIQFDGLEVAPVSGGSDYIVVSALVFYEGDHVDSQGKAISYSGDLVSEIAANSNQKLNDGIRVQLFKDHNYSSDSVIGWVEKFNAKKITSSDLPHQGMTELVGKMGVFADVAIAGDENVSRYKDKLIKSVSAGIDLEQNVIYEVSVVPFPALAGASLFAKFGLTIKETENENYMNKLYDRLSDFMQTIESIDLASPEKLQGLDPDGLKAQATEDLSAGLLEFFGVNKRKYNPDNRGLMGQEKAPDKGTTTMAESPDTAKFAAEIATLKAQLEESNKALRQAAREKAVALRFNELERKASDLVGSGKLTPAAYKSMFGADDAIAIYSKADKSDLDKVAYHLEMIEQFGGNVVQFGKLADDQPLEAADDSEAIEAAKRLSRNVLKYGGRR